MADRISELHANAVVERGERRDSEMGDDWADTFVDSPKFDPSTYNKRELAHRLDSSIYFLILSYALGLVV
jgi:hypothetical protein